MTGDIILEENNLNNDDEQILVDTINSFYITNNFKIMLEQISKKQGYGNSVRNITFWECLDEYDRSTYSEQTDGAIVEFLDEEVTIDIKTFILYLKKAVDSYIIKRPQEREEIITIMKNIEKIFGDE